LEPTEKNFLYYEDQEMATLVMSIMEFPYEVSDGWKTQYEMPVPTREETYIQEVFSTMNYLKLRKIKRLIIVNQKDLELHHNAEEQLSLLQTHKHLKDIEVKMTRQMGTVILK
jgi:DNA primase